MLSRSKAPEAQALLTEIANNKTDPSLQRVAVQTLATGRGKQAGPDLMTIYRNSTDKEVKRAAVSGLFIASDATDLVELARSEKDLNMKREIVTQLALMHDPAATELLGRKLARSLSVNVGDSLTVDFGGPQKFPAIMQVQRVLHVSGIMDSGDATEDQVLLPLAVAKEESGHPDAVSRVEISARTNDPEGEVMAKGRTLVATLASQSAGDPTRRHRVVELEVGIDPARLAPVVRDPVSILNRNDKNSEFEKFKEILLDTNAYLNAVRERLHGTVQALLALVDGNGVIR